MSFVPRSRFPFPSVAPSWFIGHMAKGLRRMRETLSSIDLVLEVRDARLPLTSINPAFEELVGNDRGFLPKNGKKRLVVYNKRDLAEPGLERPIQRALLQHAGQLCMFTDTASDADMRRVLKTAIMLAQPNFHLRIQAPVSEHPTQLNSDQPELRFMIAGMPNVGKSSLINSLRRVGVRKGKAQQVGPQAGITRKLTGTVRVWDDPITYVYDTPGLMMPYLGEGDEAVEKGLKIALSSGLKENLYDPLDLADYLLYRLNLRYFNPLFPTGPELLPSYLRPYTAHLPTNDIEPLLQAVGTRIGAIRKGGVVDTDLAARAFVQAFRDGKMGLWALDDMGLLLRGDENISQIRSDQPGGAPSSVSPLAAGTDKVYLPPSEVDQSMALIQTNSKHPSLAVADDSPTSQQVSTFVASHFAVQREAATQLSTSKNQIKKRARLEAAEERKRKWQVKHPHLSRKTRGIGNTRKAGGRIFMIGGNREYMRRQKKRVIARKVTRRRRKMK